MTDSLASPRCVYWSTRLQREVIHVAATLKKDPVCGMMIDPTTAAGKSEFRGETYYFCAPACKAEFDANPAKFADQMVAAGAGAGAGEKKWWEFWKK